MASVARQPFATLDGQRLQSLASTKNRQNASPKRKAAEEIDIFEDTENQKPLSSKRAKNSAVASPKDALRLSTTAARKLHKPSTPSSLATCTPAPQTPKKASRAVLEPKSPLARLAGVSKAAPVPKSASLSIPAGRSPPRPKRSAIIKQTSSRTSLGLSLGKTNSAPFSLNAALKGTISSAKSRQAPKPGLSIFSSAPGGRGFGSPCAFDIYEDTPEQEMTNLLQHSTCVLDISSDEESECKDLMDKADGYDKENVPPADDASQVSASRSVTPSRRPSEEMELAKDRRALNDLNAEDYYGADCDSTSVFIVPADEDDVVKCAESEKVDIWESASTQGDDEAETDVEDKA